MSPFSLLNIVILWFSCQDKCLGKFVSQLFARKDLLSNTPITDLPIFSHPGCRSRLECSVTCTQNQKCVSFFYNSETGQCSGHAVQLSSTDPGGADQGSVYYTRVYDIDECSTNEHKCDVNADCTNTPGSYTCTCYAMYDGDGFECKLKDIRGEACLIASDCIKPNFACSGGVCDCALSYSYDIVNNECVEKCDDYGTQFSHQSTTYCLSGYNDAIFDYTSVDGCAKLCAEAVEFTCRTFEIWIGYCLLSATIKSEDLDAWNPWNGCRYYQRHCAVPS